MRTLAFITWTPYSDRDYLMYDILNLKKNFKILFIDISEIIFPEFKKIKRKKSKNKFKYGITLFKAKNEKEFINILNQNSIDFCIDRFSGNINHKILKIIKEHKIKTINIFGASKLLKEQFFPLNIKFYLGKLLDFFRIKNTNYDYCLISGIMSIQQKNISYKKKIYSHSLDFDISKRPIKKKINLPKRYAVFLDENIVYHPDLNKKSNQSIKLDKVKYYRDLEKFLLYFSKKFKVKIIIAAHPTSNTQGLSELKKFKFYTYKTSELVKSSSYVLLHTSTAINYAIIFKKKMIFLDHKIFQDNYLGQTIKVNSNFFNTKSLDFSRKYEYKNFLNFITYPDLTYKKYLDYFILHPKKKNNKTISDQLNLYLKM